MHNRLTAPLRLTPARWRLESRYRSAALLKLPPMSLTLAALNAMDRHAFLAALGDIAGEQRVPAP